MGDSDYQDKIESLEEELRRLRAAIATLPQSYQDDVTDALAAKLSKDECKPLS